MILNPKGLLNNASDSTYKTARFILYVTLIFAAHMSSSVFTEKMYFFPQLDTKQNTRRMMENRKITFITF